MKVVAVSQRVDQFPERLETRETLDQRMVAFLAASGFIPVPVPNRFHEYGSDDQGSRELLGAWLAALKPHAFVLSGGNNIGQCIGRDLTEGYLLDHAKFHRSPVLGICRGMQMMANWAGVGLRQVQGHIKTRHRLAGEITGEVNSYHAFSLATCPPGFTVLARSEDGEIEAIRHQGLAWEGWMWHPEREPSFALRDIEGIKVLFSG